MSRRARRRSGKPRGHWPLRLFLGGLVLVVVLVVGGYLGIRSYLHSEAFRLMLAGQAGKALDGEAEFGRFHWHGRQVHADRMSARGKGVVRSLVAEGASMEIGIGGLRRGVWELRGGLIRRVDAELDLSGDVADGSSKSRDKSRDGEGWLPRRAELQDAEISNADLRLVTGAGKVSWSGLRMRAKSDGNPDTYLVEVDGGVLQVPQEGLPPIDFDHARLRVAGDAVYLKSLRAGAWGEAELTATGEWDRERERAALDGALTGVPSSRLLSGDWLRRVSGHFDIPFLVRVEGGNPSAEGEIHLRDGMLTALPVLDVLAAYADTSRFRILPLHEARCEWRWNPEALRFSKILLFSEGLARLEGNLVVRGRELDGVFRLGIPPGTLAHIPGAETVVFLPGEQGLLWAPLRITGTLDDPEEDLSGRLISAAGLRLFEELPETGEKALRFSHRLAEDVAPKVLEEGLRILDQGKGVIDDANGILKGILGSPEKEGKLLDW